MVDDTEPIQTGTLLQLPLLRYTRMSSNANDWYCRDMSVIGCWYLCHSLFMICFLRGKRSSSINILFQCVTVPIDPLKRFLCVFVSLCICVFWEAQVFVPLHKNTKLVFLCFCVFVFLGMLQ